MSDKKNPLVKSFGFAFRGIFKVFKKERNIKIHFSFAFLVVGLGIILKISFLSWAILLLTIALVISLEMVNSAIEGICNLLNEKLNLDYSNTTFIRDASAGAVLVTAVLSVFIGLLVFLPYIL